MRRPVLLLTTASLLSLPACHLEFDERVTGTAIGVGAGALAGGLLGSAVASTGTGAVLGAIAGGAAGYIIGDWMADKRERGTSQARARDHEYERGRSEAEETVAPAPAPQPATFDAVPASGAKSATATAERAEMARREYEAGRRATDPTTALGHYDAASRYDPSRPEPHNARGLVLLYQGQKSEARAAFQRSLAVDPGYAPAAENLKKASASR